MSQCKIEYENAIPEEQRTPTKWHIWKRAWNAAVRCAVNDTNQLREPT